MKYLAIIFLCIAASCQHIGSSAHKLVAQTEYDTADGPSAKQPATSDSLQHAELLYTEGHSLLAGAYRMWEAKDNPGLILKKGWLQLFRDGHEGFKIDDAQYSIANGYDTCAGIETRVVTSKRETLAFFNIPGIHKGTIPCVQLEQQQIWPQKRVVFEFMGHTYTLRAEGEITATDTYTDNGDAQVFHHVSGYRLVLIDRQQKQYTLAAEDSFNDTFIRIVFVGDLDGDRKPDFILSAPRDYEEERILIVLSSKMDNETPEVYECHRQFDC